MNEYTAADYAMLHALETNLESWSDHFKAPPHPPEPLVFFALPPILDHYLMSPPPPPLYEYILPPARSWRTHQPPA
jgi:hypothetical protein